MGAGIGFKEMKEGREAERQDAGSITKQKKEIVKAQRELDNQKCDGKQRCNNVQDTIEYGERVCMDALTLLLCKAFGIVGEPKGGAILKASTEHKILHLLGVLGYLFHLALKLFEYRFQLFHHQLQNLSVLICSIKVSILALRRSVINAHASSLFSLAISRASGNSMLFPIFA